MNTLNLTGKSFPELLSLFLCDVQDDDFYDIIGYNLISAYPTQIYEIADQFYGKRLRGLIFGWGVAKEKHDGINKYLHHEDEFIVAETIDALRHMECFSFWSLIREFLTHKSAYIRSATLRFAKAHLGDAAKAILLQALKDTSPLVRENAIDELEGLIQEEDILQISEFLYDHSENVRFAARNILDNFHEE